MCYNISMDKKLCKWCSKEKTINKFYYNNTLINGIFKCKKCHMRDEHAKRKIVGSRAWWGVKHARIKRSGKLRNIEHNLTVDDVIAIKSKGECVYCGDALNIKNATIDRVDNNVGYVRKNCVCACMFCNKVKSYYFNGQEMRIIGVAVRIRRERLSKI